MDIKKKQRNPRKKPVGKRDAGRADDRRSRRDDPSSQEMAEQARRRAMGQVEGAFEEIRAETALPQEEVYRPTPTQDRHSQENPQTAAPTGEQPRTKRVVGSKKKRPFGKFAARRQAKAASGKDERPAKKNSPAVIYTKPLPFNLNRLLMQLLTVAALVLAFTLGLSIFFRVDKITVSGANIYSEWAVREASGIEVGDALLTFNRSQAGAKIRAELPYVDRIRFGIKLPDTVIIDIKELEVAYPIQATDGMWWFITSEGRVVEQTDEGTAGDFTKITGVIIEYPEVNTAAVAWEQRVATDPAQTGDAQAAPDDSETTGPVTVTNADRLAAALRIVQAMELCDVVGEVAEVNVSDLGAIILTYGGRYEVRLGNTDNLEFKITAMRDAVAQMSDFQRGVLDVTFTIWPDKVVFTPSEN